MYFLKDVVMHKSCKQDIKRIKKNNKNSHQYVLTITVTENEPNELLTVSFSMIADVPKNLSKDSKTFCRNRITCVIRFFCCPSNIINTFTLQIRTAHKKE